jgi:hypothetical protein
LGRDRDGLDIGLFSIRRVENTGDNVHMHFGEGFIAIRTGFIADGFGRARNDDQVVALEPCRQPRRYWNPRFDIHGLLDEG